MKRFAIALFIAAAALYGAQEVEVVAKKFEADQDAHIAKFFEDVVFKRGEDVIESDEAYIFFDKNKKPIKFRAVKNVRFTLHHEGKTYKGRCEELIYFPKKREYILKKDVFVEQLPDGKKIYAEHVLLSLATGSIDVEGASKKPVKMVFEIEEENATAR